jgi:hypothetical protein
MSSRTLAPSRSAFWPAALMAYIPSFRAELTDFFHAGRQLFAIIVPIEHHVGILPLLKFGSLPPGRAIQ